VASRNVDNVLSRLLYERGLTDGEVARRAGLPRSRINRLKNGHVRPTVRDALLIASALGVRVRDVFSLCRLDDADPD